MNYAVIDIETTGGDLKMDQITEVAIVITDGEKIIDEYSSLVNPGRAVPDYISKLTGITTEMVKDAPRFYEVAKEIVLKTEDCFFVAHNARFDYSFIKRDFLALGFDYRRRQICTRKLARKLFPELPSCSLGNLTKHFGIRLMGHHRALNDARATAELLHLLLKQEESEKALKAQLKRLTLPPNLDPALPDRLPQAPGVYFFHDQHGNVIYVGKSKTIRSRVLSHFNNDLKRNRFAEMKAGVHDISWELTGTELIALIHEANEIKQIQPHYNRAQRSSKPHEAAISISQGESGYLVVEILKPDECDDPIRTYATKKHALGALKSRAEEYGLCLKLTGVEQEVRTLFSSDGSCSGVHTGFCEGACVGDADVDAYNERMREAFPQSGYPMESFIIAGTGRNPDEKSFILIEDRRYRGYGFMAADAAISHPEELDSYILCRKTHPGLDQMIRDYLSRNEMELIPLSAHSLTRPSS